ncbi:hypothetical protein [Photobacterium damselae]|uniref:hypothetical protein n=1 Tax=Photobacterium damselae TaxID=38293 RepID=UPI001593B254|nr:hypothetical protein [Photobacterium damselae]NVH48264.1 hypothetical protein [Photobacterium damselae subsp. damselae]
MSKLLFMLMMVLSKSLSLLAVFLYAKYLDIDEIAKWSDIVSIYFLLFPIISLQLQSGIFRFSIKYRLSVIPIVNISTILYFLSCIMILISFSYDGRYIYSFILCFCAITFHYHLEYIRATIKEKLYYFLSFSSVFLSFIISILLLIEYKSFKSIIFGEFCGISIILMYSFYLLRINSKFRLKFNKNIFKAIVFYSLPLIPNAISWWFITTGAISISNLLLSGNSAAIVNINLKASLIISSSGFIFSTIMQRTLIEKYEESRVLYRIYFIDKLKKIFIVLMLITLFSNVSFWSFLSYYYNDYYIGYDVIVLSSMSGFMYSLSSILGVMYICQKKTGLALKSITLSSLISVILMCILSRYFDIYGIFLSLLVGFTINVLIRVYDFKGLVLNEK